MFCGDIMEYQDIYFAFHVISYSTCVFIDIFYVYIYNGRLFFFGIFLFLVFGFLLLVFVFWLLVPSVSGFWLVFAGI